MRVRPLPVLMLAATLVTLGVPAARAQTPVQAPEAAPPYGQTVVHVVLQVTGHPDYPQSLLSLVEVKPQQPLTRDAWRRSVELLVKLGRFEDIRVDYRAAGGGVDVIFVAEPAHPVTRLEFVGAPGLEGALRHRVLETFGGMPADVAPGLVQDAMIAALRDEGYLQATATVGRTTFANPDRATLTFTIVLGPLAQIGQVKYVISNTAALTEDRLARETGVGPGKPYRPGVIRDALGRAVDGLKAKGYYTAEPLLPDVKEASDHTFDLTLTVDTGPLVILQWDKAGQPPSGDINDYVPARQQNSIDNDLLDDAKRRIEGLLKTQGYLDVHVDWTMNQPSTDTQMFTFHVTRGPRYFVDQVVIPPGLGVPVKDIEALLKVGRGDVENELRVSQSVANIEAEYRRRGHYKVDAVFVREAAPRRPATAKEAWEVLRLNITEGPRGDALVVKFDRAASDVPEADLRQIVDGVKGSPFLPGMDDAVATALKTFYDSLGYRNADVKVTHTFSDDERTLTRLVKIDERQRVRVADVTVIGWHDVSERAIREEMMLHPGEWFGATAQVDSQRRVYDMGVFRQVTVQPLDPLGPNDTAVHLIVRVVEAPDTTISYGGDVEAGRKSRSVNDTGGRVDRLEFAPRGFFEIGRRNLGGRNRVLDLFTRVSLRPKDAPNTANDGKGYSFSEYRVALTYRERRLLSTHTDMTSGISSEQAIRSTFNFRRQAGNVEFVRGLKPRLTATARYTIELTKLYDEQVPLTLDIDRVFAQVRLSILSFSLLNDRRDDAIAPSRGTLVSGETDVALRAIGSEVGYTKTFVQASAYRRLTSTKRVVGAVRGELGIARGFARPDPTTPGGTIEDIPASQRFFAGGSTTVRGFQLDRLGTPAVLSDQGLSFGGNGLVIVNAELRTTVGKLFGRDFGVVQFVDAGNIFAKMSDISLAQLRTSLGLGIRYDSPVGPLRLDFGFKTSRLVFNGVREHGWEYHVSFGQVF